MKIAVISNLFEPFERGGGEKVAKSLINELGKSNEIIVISTKAKGLKVELQEKRNQKIYRFCPLNIYYYLNDYKHNAFIRFIWHFFDQFNWHSLFVIRKIIKKENPDVVITHNLMGIGFLVPWAFRKHKWIHVLHDVQLAVPSGLIIKGHEKDFVVSGFAVKLYARINKWLFRSPQKIVSPSKWLLDFHNEKGFFKNSIKLVLPNPVSLKIKSEPKSEFEKPMKILFAGQIQEHKGIMFLVKALKQFELEYKLIIAGAGTKEIELKSIIHDDNRFRFVGKVDTNQIKDLLSFSDYLIVPSLCYENSPTVIYEAFSQGVPVIASDIGGIPELVKENETGVVFEAGNKQSLIGSIKRADKTHNYIGLSKNCINFAVKNTIENYCSNLLDNK